MWYLWRTTASAAPTASAVLAAATPDSVAVVQFMVILYYMYVCLPYIHIMSAKFSLWSYYIICMYACHTQYSVIEANCTWNPK